MSKTIEIKYNSGTQMAGIKIRKKWWEDKDVYYNILYVHNNKVFYISSDGTYNVEHIDCDWEKYEENKISNTKYARAAWTIKKNILLKTSKCNWQSSATLYESEEDVRSDILWADKVIWPAKFDNDGFLIVPKEFQ